MAFVLEHFAGFDQMVLADSAVRRLGMACLLGGLVGLERELSHKPAGIRTNVFVCMACAFFTLLSIEIAGPGSPNKGQIAANIVQGIGFLGAGLILRNRFRIEGLTSAATVFVVASIGMACGAGLYLAAAFATGIVVAAMLLIGAGERYLGLKEYPVIYEVRGADPGHLGTAALRVLDHFRRRLSVLDQSPVGDVNRLVFAVNGTMANHKHLLEALRAQPGVTSAHSYRETDEE